MLLGGADVDVPLQASDGDELIARLPESAVEVVILDIRMPPSFTDEGLRTAARIRDHDSEVGILLLSTYAETSYAVQLLDSCQHSVGYLLKDRVSNTTTLLDALTRVTAGETVIDSGIVRRLLGRRRDKMPLEDLTDREQTVLRLMAEGRSNAGIAHELFIGTKTVERHIATILQRLDIHGTADDNRRVLAVLTWLRVAGSK
jgi:DNA-binding NarL/FixJ family response regulator